MPERARRYLMDALNGDRDQVDPAVRRGLFANAQSIDSLRSEREEWADRMERERQEWDVRMETMMDEVKAEVVAQNRSTRRTVVGGSLSVAGAIVVAIITGLVQSGVV